MSVMQRGNVYLFMIILMTIANFARSQQQQQPGIIKGVKSGEVILVCAFPPSANPTISWVKTSNTPQIHVATQFSGDQQFSETVRDRASLQGGNLTIRSLSLSDEGNYTCNVIASEFQPLSRSIMLVITAAPTVNAEPTSSPNIDENETYIAAICHADSGKPAASIRWLDHDGAVMQESRNQRVQNEDKSWNVSSELILTTGLLGRSPNSTLLLSPSEKVRNFTCDVIHSDLDTFEDRRATVSVDLLFSPLTHISILGNQLTCHAEGNPKPNLQWVIPSGQIIEEKESLYLGQDERDNGVYSCLATSTIPPHSQSTIDVQKSKDLPILFRTLVKLNTSIPVSASGYEITCSAEVEGVQNNANNVLEFVWMKNSENIIGNTYQILIKTEAISSSRSRLSSSLKFLDVVRGRDDATFRCRLINTSSIIGFVSAMERSIAVSVDYSPETVKVSGKPSGFILEEGETLTLSCVADSKPISAYRWYLRDRKLHTGSTFTISGVQRSDAGTYRCVAYNYVPGSAHNDVIVTVLHPPSDLVIVEQPGGGLSCVARSGSQPKPIYSWVYPNSTITSGNTSEISLLPPPKQKPYYYMCIARNSIGSANVTFMQSPPDTLKVGAVTLMEFIIIIACVVAVFLFAILVACLVRRKCCGEKKQSLKMSAEEAFRQYLQYSEPPGVVSVTLAGKRNPSSVTRSSASSDSSSDIKKSSQTSPLEIRRVMSDLDVENFQADSLQQPTTSMGTTNTFSPAEERPRNNTQNDEPLHSNEYSTILDDGGFGSVQGVKALQNRIHSQSTNSARSADEYQESVSVSTLPSEAKLRGVRPDLSGQIQPPPLIPLQYFHHKSSATPDYETPVLPMHFKRQYPPVRVMVPAQPGSEESEALYTQPWKPTNSRLNQNLSPHYSTSTFGPSVVGHSSYPFMDASSSHSATAPADNYDGEQLRPRSMSLSGSSSCSGRSGSLSSNPFGNIERRSAVKQSKKQMSNDRSPTRTLSPFDSGNDSARSGQVVVPANKKPSLTLV